MVEYYALFTPAPEGGFTITFPEFAEAITQGETEQEAQQMAADALATVIEHYIVREKALPSPRKHRGGRHRGVALPARQAMKVALYIAFEASGVHKVEFARRLGMSRTKINRLFSLRHQSRLDQIEAAFQAIGKTLDFTVRDLCATA